LGKKKANFKKGEWFALRHPLGSLIVAVFKSSGGRQILRYNGDRARLSHELEKLHAHPGYDLRVLEPLVKVPGSWTVLLETFETGAPGPFCVVCYGPVEDDGEFMNGSFFCAACVAPYADEGVE
jgi:hypothetical protein